MTPTTRKSLRDQADRLFSEYIRRRFADENGKVFCACGCQRYDRWFQIAHNVDDKLRF